MLYDSSHVSKASKVEVAGAKVELLPGWRLPAAAAAGMSASAARPQLVRLPGLPVSARAWGALGPWVAPAPVETAALDSKKTQMPRPARRPSVSHTAVAICNRCNCCLCNHLKQEGETASVPSRSACDRESLGGPVALGGCCTSWECSTAEHKTPRCSKDQHHLESTVQQGVKIHLSIVHQHSHMRARGQHSTQT